jgi:hypothetical protein
MTAAATADDFIKWRKHAKTLTSDQLIHVICDCKNARAQMLTKNNEGEPWNPVKAEYYADQSMTYGDELRTRKNFSVKFSICGPLASDNFYLSGPHHTQEIAFNARSTEELKKVWRDLADQEGIGARNMDGTMEIREGGPEGPVIGELCYNGSIIPICEPKAPGR